VKFNVDWLRDFVNVDFGADQLAEELTMAGLEVDSVEPVAGVLNGVVVAEIVDKQPTSVRVLGPKTSNHAPSGWYMLFLVTSEGVPSEAAWVHVE